jgi:c-di-GMP-binding flagellar brake protein YcgR
VALIPVLPDEIEIDRPLVWALRDAQGEVLYAVGETLTAGDVTKALQQELFREAAEQPQAAAGFAEVPASVPESVARLQLAPGDAIQLQLCNEKNIERYTVKVVGHMAPISLLVTAPYANGKLLFVREGQTFLVRSFIGQDALAYRTRVLKTQLAPFPYLHLAYPVNVQSMRIRKSARSRIDLVTAISGPRGNSAGRIADLSLGGAKIISSTAFANRGDEVRLAFRIKPGGIDIYMDVKAIVRGVQQEQMEQPCVTTGVEFVELSEQDHLALMSTSYQYMLRDTL